MKHLAISLIILLCSAGARAGDFSGQWGVGFDAGWGARLGSKEVVNTAGNGSALGGSVLRGFTPRWRGALNYENIDLHGRRFEPITVSAIYAFMPDRRLTPIAEFGVGGARASRIPDSRSNETALALKGAVGLEYAICEHFTAAAKAALYNAGHTSTSIGHEVDAATLGVALTWWFGARTPKIAATPVPAPLPPVSIALKPVSADLGQGASQAFSPAVANAQDKGVIWSIDPQLGSISPAGVYTAPGSVPLSQTVNVTATSIADSSKKATSVIHLIAAEKVSIALDVTFDIAKSAVKPEFDPELRKVADFMKTYPATKAEIAGYTSNTGTPEYNKKLSQRRADAVRGALIERFGVDGSRLTAVGYGEEHPIADNSTDEGRAKNRRVVATFTAIKQ